MRLNTIITALTAAFAATTAVKGSNVIDLVESNFDSVIGQGTPALVEFFAPWCGHCKNLAPTYESLADAFSSPSSKSKVIIAKVDADSAEGKGLGARFGVRGFPTLKWFGADDADHPSDYEGGRDLDSLAGYITQQTGAKSSIKPPPPSAVTELDSSNFKSQVGGEKDVLVAFTAPWCGHCKNLKPVWEKVATDFKAEKNVLIAQVNADADENKPLASEFGVQGFPTIKFFPRGSAVPEDYQGGRSEEAFVDFINEKSGTFRAVGGRLLASAGKVLSLDKLASQFFTTTTSRPDILKQAQEYVASLSASASDGVKRATKTETPTEYYLKAMQRILDKGEGWVEKETARISKLLQSTSLAPEKLDELQTKNNILSSFAHRIYDEAEEALSDVSLEDVEDAVRHATASAKTIAAQATDRVKAEL